MLVHPPTPRANHVLMPRDEQLQPRAIPLPRRIYDERVDRNPVAPAAEDGNVVDFEAEAGTWLIEERFLNDAQAPESNLLRLRIENGAVLREWDDEIWQNGTREKDARRRRVRP